MVILENISLKPYNTFGIDVLTKQFTTFSTVDELQTVITDFKSQISHAGLILGAGSNVLFTKNFDGIILKNELKGISLVKEDDEHVYVKANAGENWHSFVLYCINRNYAGIENLSLIPGTVGASPMQNIGAYGVEIKDVFYQLEALHIPTQTVQTFNIKDCEFDYRSSIFKTKLKGQFVILSVTYRLNKYATINTSYGAIEKELEVMQITNPTIKSVSDAVIRIRSSKLPDPSVIGNAGSFFKNPIVSKFRRHAILERFKDLPSFSVDAMHYKIAAGWLIEKCGFKGIRKGDAGCHLQQALVLVNYGHANGKEIYDLSEEIVQTVRKEFGIELEREVNII